MKREVFAVLGHRLGDIASITPIDWLFSSFLSWLMSSLKVAWSSWSDQAYLPKLMSCYLLQILCEKM
jgi:hypothetical protein